MALLRIDTVVRETHPSNMRGNEALRAQIDVPQGMDSGAQLQALEDRVLKPMIAAGIDRYTI